MRPLEERSFEAACRALGLEVGEAEHHLSASGAVVFSYGDRIYRVATSRLLIEQQLHERELLPKLAGNLPVEPPRLLETGDFPVYMAYEKIPGRSLRYRDFETFDRAESLKLAGEMGEILTVLHDFDPGAPVQADYEHHTFEEALPFVMSALREGRFDREFDAAKRALVIQGIEEAVELWRDK